MHDLALRIDRLAVLSGRDRRLDGQTGRRPERRTRVRSEIFHRLASGTSAASDSSARRRLFVGFVLLPVTSINLSTSPWWMWVVIAGLGTFHGLNPAMGWLFAVALGLYRRSRRVVLLSLVPIALGHAIAAACVLTAGVSLSATPDHHRLNRLCGPPLFASAPWHP